MLPFAFTRGEIATARVVSNHRHLSVRELSERIGKSESSISHTVKSLEAKGILETRRDGMRKSVDYSDRNYAQSLRDLLKAKPFVPWEELLSNSNIAVLFENSTGEASFAQALSTSSSWRAIRNLSIHGIIRTRSGLQSARDNTLSRFVSEYSDHVSRKYLAGIIPDEATIIWRSGYRCLFSIASSSGTVKQGFPEGTFTTAITAAPDLGIRFIAKDSYYYHDPTMKELTIEDIILHTLLIGSGSQTYGTYALLMAYKARGGPDVDILMQRSSRYRLEKEAEHMAGYIRSHGRKRERPFPDLAELREQADLYGIVID